MADDIGPALEGPELVGRACAGVDGYSFGSAQPIAWRVGHGEGDGRAQGREAPLAVYAEAATTPCVCAPGDRLGKAKALLDFVPALLVGRKVGEPVRHARGLVAPSLRHPCRPQERRAPPVVEAQDYPQVVVVLGQGI